MGEASRAAVVYFSATGTTRRYARAVASGFGEVTRTFDLLERPPRDEVGIPADEVAVFAVPVFAGRVPAVCVDALRRFKSAGARAVALAVYGNRDYEDALVELVDLLEEGGFAVVAGAALIAQHSIFNEVATGRPDAADKEKTAAFVARCRDLMSQEKQGRLVVKGNRPYKDVAVLPMHPSGDASCDMCGVCAMICPTKAIDRTNPRATDPDKCCSCMACVARCPRGARKMDDPLFHQLAPTFAEKNAARKEPEFFYAE